MSVPDSYGLPAARLSVDLATPTRALAIGAHPDDVEYGCGGTLAKWAAQGCSVFHVVLTDGSKGTWDHETDTSSLIVTRQREQREAARRLGGAKDVGDVVFLNSVDGELEAGLRQRWELAYWIRHFQPEVVLGHDPWRRYRIHPDHRNAGFLTTDAIVAARDPKFFPEQRIGVHRPTTLLLWEAEEPDHVEDVATGLAAKIRALLAHESQFATTMLRGAHGSAGLEALLTHLSAAPFGDASTLEGEAEALLQRFVDDVSNQAREAGRLAGIETGEAFKRIDRL